MRGVERGDGLKVSPLFKFEGHSITSQVLHFNEYGHKSLSAKDSIFIVLAVSNS